MRPPSRVRDASAHRRETLRRWRRALWGVVLVVHVGYAVAYAFEARYYVETIVTPPYFTLLLTTFGRADSLNANVCVAVLATSTGICGWHVRAAFRMVRTSFVRKRLVFRDHRTLTIQTQSPRSRLATVWMRVTLPWHWLARRWMQYGGVDGVYFETVTDLRESFEIGTQTYVVYRLSRLVADTGINHAAALALVVNCWSTPLLRTWLAASPRGPLIRTLVGAALASVFTVVLPFAVFARYYRLALAPIATRYDPQFFIDRGILFQQVFTLTWTDWLSTRLAALFAIASLETIKRKGQENRSRPQHKDLVAVGPEAKPPCSDEHPAVRSQLLNLVAVSHHSHRAANCVFLAVGLAVLALHIVASSHREPFQDKTTATTGMDCSLVLRPWLQRRSLCAVLSLNCHRLQIQGCQHEWDAVLRPADELFLLSNLMGLRVSHCARLEMPTQIQHMHRLIQIVVFNVTLASWTTQAALTVRSHPVLASVVLLHVQNMPELPAGLLADDFPAIVFESSGTDLHDLPRNLTLLWPQQMEAIAIERARLSSVPLALQEIQTGRLSLAGNSIRRVPAALFSNHDYYRAIQLTDNPLDDLPIQDVMSFQALSLGLVGTNISMLPEWAAQAARLPHASEPFIHADDSPLCRYPSVALQPKLIECETPMDRLIRYTIPLDEFAAANPP